MFKSILIIDCQNDFISGSLACDNGEIAVKNIINLLNINKDLKVFYSLDWHSENNKSFKINGGIWPVHCVANRFGAKLEESFYKELQHKNHSPNNKKILFLKGKNDYIEEYSAYEGENILGNKINEVLDKDVIVCGIASEFCVKETVEDLIRNGFNVELYIDGVAYVNKKEHEKTLNNLREQGIKFI
ncbi:nicotinamidase [Clostridium botulinum A2B7 92]|uniref:isochorismatase family protein n=1 Tax=Clostridium botulinum TaxID=1491 RepID=UPI0007DFC8B9|nr:isochorismatase family protein [Clostridium botulinum]KEJ00538.1 nicotinamidase [Clostridium botulinum A2B7 92]